MSPKLSASGKPLELPIFFPSVSSVKTNFTLLEYVKILHALAVPTFLVSAYDTHHAGTDRAEVIRLLGSAKSAGATILLDSGNYESYWHGDSEWE